MIKYYTFVEPKSKDDMSPIYHTLSENDILEKHWDYFTEKLRKLGLDETNYNKFDCIDDWVVTHWAWESTNNGTDSTN